MMFANVIFLCMYRPLKESPNTSEKQTLLTKPFVSPGKCSDLTNKTKLNLYIHNITTCVLVDFVQKYEAMLET